MNDRPTSPDALVVRPTMENAGPSAEADAEFAKELAKMMSDTSSDARRVDKRTALAMWDSATLPGTGVAGNRRRRDEQVEGDEENEIESPGTMKFTVLSKKGNKQQVRLC
jgi:regulator of nonsense transcripts 2